ncbi:lysophospholipase [Sphingomonas sp. DBB INV C78]|uniref:DUF1489 family protein n=1 Tax=Sphingomonas sp. DBB INV C78 TaxID=3349434 RepID=UPI0036D2BEF4
MLHMTKVAVGCSSVEILRDRITARATNGTTTIHTRYRPTRAAEMVGGSLYWIIAHRLIARQTILGFEEGENGHCLIRVDARVVPVRARPKRAHQGWRYLKADDAPQDFDGSDADVAAMPKAMVDELSALSLI